MKPPPPKKEEDMNLKELREYRRLKEAEAEADRLEKEARDEALIRMTEVQNYLIANVESDIRIVKHKIDDMKEEYRQFDNEADFAERLEKLYIELGDYENRLTMIKIYPYNSPITTDTSNRNPSWFVSEVNSDPNFSVGYEEDTFNENVFCPKSDYPPSEFRKIDYDAQLDKLNEDL
jgi:hypothetical protein